MNMTKKINVNFSSLVGLKAELLRKQAEVNKIKFKIESVNVPLQPSKKRTKKATVEGTEKNTKEKADPEDVKIHKKSRLMLEAKTRLYDSLKKSKTDNNKFLVDFKNKVDEEFDDSIDATINEEYPIEPEENWVEYQDCFGRTRKCLREDLPHMQRKDDIIKLEIMKRNTDEVGEDDKREQYSTIEEKEPEIEIMRRKWEEQMQKLADKANIHYQDVLFDEARTHGVGYYAFSQDEEERIKQQENLTNLRKETERKQKEMNEMRELKEKMEQNRLKAARIRQRIRAGLPAEPTKEELALENNSTIKSDNPDIKEVDDKSAAKSKEISSEETDIKSVKDSDVTSENTAANNEDKIKAFGELLDKKNRWHIMSQEEWVDKCRSQRIKQFAPVYGNFKSAGFYNNNRDIDAQLSHEDKLDNNSEKTKHNSKDNTNVENYEVDDESTTDEQIPIVRNISNNQNDNLAECDTINKDNTRNELHKNATESTSNLASVPNQLLPQRQATVLYPLSHLSSSKYSQVVLDYPTEHATELCNTIPNTEDIPLPGESTSICTELNDPASINKQESLSCSINEDNIMAGLKYLREKFEKSHSK